jgi:hypothetical protein
VYQISLFSVSRCGYRLFSFSSTNSFRRFFNSMYNLRRDSCSHCTLSHNSLHLYDFYLSQYSIPWDGAGHLQRALFLCTYIFSCDTWSYDSVILCDQATRPPHWLLVMNPGMVLCQEHSPLQRGRIPLRFSVFGVSQRSHTHGTKILNSIKIACPPLADGAGDVSFALLCLYSRETTSNCNKSQRPF